MQDIPKAKNIPTSNCYDFHNNLPKTFNTSKYHLDSSPSSKMLQSQGEVFSEIHVKIGSILTIA